MPGDKSVSIYKCSVRKVVANPMKGISRINFGYGLNNDNKTQRNYYLGDKIPRSLPGEPDRICDYIGDILSYAVSMGKKQQLVIRSTKATYDRQINPENPNGFVCMDEVIDLAEIHVPLYIYDKKKKKMVNHEYKGTGLWYYVAGRFDGVMVDEHGHLFETNKGDYRFQIHPDLLECFEMAFNRQDVKKVLTERSWEQYQE